MRLGLQAKFITLAGVFILVAAVIGNRLVLQYEEEQLRTQVQEEATILAESMAMTFLHTMVYQELGLVDEADVLDLYVEDLMRRGDLALTYVKLLDPDGVVLAHSDYRLVGSRDLHPRLQRTHIHPPATREGLEVATPLRIGSRYWGTLIMGVSLVPIGRELGQFAYRLGVATLIITSIALLCVFLVAGALALPIRRLAQEMATVGPQLESALRVDRHDEIGQLQVSFLDMLARLRAERAEREAMREAMSRAEKLAAVGGLASGVAHEVNNPLGGLRNCLKQIEAHPHDTRRRNEYVHLMQTALERIETVVRGLLDFSRQRPPETGPVAVRDVVRSALRLIEYRLQKNGLHVDVDIEAGLDDIQADRHHIEQVLINLCLNAIDSMAGGGCLCITARRQTGQVQLAVRDTGCGIPDHLRQRVFDPFFSTKEAGQGTGLGLAVSLNIVRAHGGDLTCRPAPGGGTEFVIALPLPDRDRSREPTP